jgi:hypothetical protein
LNGLVAEWEGTIRAPQAAPPAERGGKRRTAAEVLAALEEALHAVDAQARGHQRAAAAAAAAASEWEQKAELAIRGNRDAMARDALLRQAEHAAAAADEAAAAGRARRRARHVRARDDRGPGDGADRGRRAAATRHLTPFESCGASG